MAKSVEKPVVMKKGTDPKRSVNASKSGEKAFFLKKVGRGENVAMIVRLPAKRVKPPVLMKQEDAEQREKVLFRAIEVIEDKERALRWMGTPVRGLGFATPVSLLGTAKGRGEVLKILDQLEHGVW
jgi:hypothetical protein